MDPAEVRVRIRAVLARVEAREQEWRAHLDRLRGRPLQPGRRGIVITPSPRRPPSRPLQAIGAAIRRAEGGGSPRIGRPPSGKTPTCHPDRPLYARAMCATCYQRARDRAGGRFGPEADRRVKGRRGAWDRPAT